LFLKVPQTGQTWSFPVYSEESSILLNLTPQQNPLFLGIRHSKVEGDSALRGNSGDQHQAAAIKAS
jgi:hypothetical protein